MPVKAPQLLTELCTTIFERMGTPADIAQIVAKSLVLSNLLGHDSHGVMRAMTYVDKIRAGTLLPEGRPQLAETRGAAALIDCNWGFGQVAARYGVQVAADLARRYNIGCAALRQVNHTGRVGEYAELLAKQGLIGLVMTSGAMFGGSVAPYGGRERVFGTNPLALAVPTGEDRPPLVTDFATSGVSIGKLLVALSEGKPIMPGLLLDQDGNPTTDPADIDRGGALLPFGGYKGYGLTLMIEIIPTLLTGFAPASSSEYSPGNPTLIIALRVEAFTKMARFYRLVGELLTRVKSVSRQDGFDDVLLPGEPESRTYAVRSSEGIPIPDKTWDALVNLARELGEEVPP